MKTLIVYPTYALSQDEVSYRATTVVNAAMGNGYQSKKETLVTPFHSTSTMLRTSSGPRREIIIDGEGGTIGGSTPGGSDQSIGATTPIGDVVLPMTLMLLGYVLYRRLAAKLKSL